MANKPQRHAVILELIAGNDVGSHEQLRKLLERRGVSVTQATLSRDLRELGLVRLPGDNGARYALPEKPGDTIPSLKTLLPQLFSSIDGVGELIVLHTLASGAQPVSEAIDAAGDALRTAGLRPDGARSSARSQAKTPFWLSAARPKPGRRFYSVSARWLEVGERVKIDR